MSWNEKIRGKLGCVRRKFWRLSYRIPAEAGHVVIEIRPSWQRQACYPYRVVPIVGAELQVVENSWCMYGNGQEQEGECLIDLLSAAR